MRIALALAVLPLVVLVPLNLQAQDWRTVTSYRQYRGEDHLSVQVEYGAGTLNVSPARGNGLYKTTLRYDANAFKPVTRYQDGLLRVGIEGGSIKGKMKAGRLDLALGTQTPLDLEMKFGAGEANVELGGLRIRELTLSTGASETNLTVSSPNTEDCEALKFEIGAAEFRASDLGNLNCERIDVSGGVGDVVLDFSGAWRVDANVDINMGLGSLTLRLPRGLGVQVQKSGLLAKFDSQGLVKRGDVYYSENWQQASNRMTIDINAALGTINVQWVDSTR